MATEEEWRGFLIAAGTQYYKDGAFQRLDHVPAEIDTIVEVLCKPTFGYERVLADVSFNPSPPKFLKRLTKWARSPERTDDDVAILYYTGHGVPQADRLLLVARSTERHGDALEERTAIAAEELVQALAGPSSRVRRSLILLDTCHAGQGAEEILQRVPSLSREHALDDRPDVLVVAAALPTEEAAQLVFAKSLVAAVEQEAEAAGRRHEFLAFDYIAEALFRSIAPDGRDAGNVQVPLWGGIARRGARFFKNPNFIRDLPQGIDLAEQERLASLAPALRVSPGFIGRAAALEELRQFVLGNKSARVCLVTGQPGAGKSALLAEFVRILPQAPAISVVVLSARISTVSMLWREIGARIGIQASTPEALIDEMQLGDMPALLVLDGLDEAEEPELLATQLIEPLAEAGIKLVVGGRPKAIARLATGDRPKIDLDAPDYRDPDALGNFVLARLARGDTTASLSLNERAAAARAIVAWANGNFLLGKLAAEAGWIPSRDRTAASLPERIGGALDHWLDRFGDQRDRAWDLLRPLAWAKGGGLPRTEAWPAIAARLAGRPYSLGDIHWLLQHAASLIVEVRADERSVYRLIHTALAEHLRAASPDDAATNRLIVAALLDLVPTRAGIRDWAALEAYGRAHLSEHAAAAGRIDELAEEGGYLLVAAPEQLLAALRTGARLPTCAAIQAYQRTVHLLERADSATASAQLELAARQQGAEALRRSLGRLPLTPPWSCAWLDWTYAPTPSLVLDAVPSSVSALAVGDLEGEPVVAVGCVDETVRLIGVRQRRILSAFPISEKRASKPRGGLMRRHLGSLVYPIRALTFHRRSEAPVLLIADFSGRISVHRLPDGELLERLPEPRLGEGSSLGVRHGRPLAILLHGGRRYQVNDLESGEVLANDVIGREGWYGRRTVVADRLIAFGEMQTQRQIESHRTYIVIDLETGEDLGCLELEDEFRTDHGVAAGSLDGQIVLATSSGFEQWIDLWRTGRPRRLMRRRLGGLGGRAMAFARLDDTPVLVSSGGSCVRVWWAAAADHRSPESISSGPYVVAAGCHDEAKDALLLVGTGDGRVQLRRPHDGRGICQPFLVKGNSPICRVASTLWQGHRFVAAADLDGHVRVWDEDSGNPIGPPIADSVPFEGRLWWLSLIVMGADLRLIGSVGRGGIRVWDPTRGERDPDLEAWLYTERAAAIEVAVAQRHRSISPQGLSALVNGHLRDGWSSGMTLLPDVGEPALLWTETDAVLALRRTCAARHLEPLNLPQMGALAGGALRDGTTVLVARPAAMGSANKIFIIRDPLGNGQRVELDAGRPATWLAVGCAADGRAMLAAADMEDGVTLWDLERPAVLWRLDTLGHVTSLTFAGPMLVVGAQEGVFAIANAE
jgi:hypothetical protein